MNKSQAFKEAQEKDPSIDLKCKIGLQHFFKPNERDDRTGVPGVAFSHVNRNDTSALLLVICGNVRIEASVTGSGTHVFARSQVSAKGVVDRQPVKGVITHAEGWPIYLRDGIQVNMPVKVILDN